MMNKFVAMAAMAVAAQAYEINLDVLTSEKNPEYTYPMGTKVTVTGIENRSWGYAWDIQNECGAKFNLIDDSYGYDEPESQMMGR